MNAIFLYISIIKPGIIRKSIRPISSIPFVGGNQRSGRLPFGSGYCLCGKCKGRNRLSFKAGIPKSGDFFYGGCREIPGAWGGSPWDERGRSHISVRKPNHRTNRHLILHILLHLLYKAWRNTNRRSFVSNGIVTNLLNLCPGSRLCREDCPLSCGYEGWGGFY